MKLRFWVNLCINGVVAVVPLECLKHVYNISLSLGINGLIMVSLESILFLLAVIYFESFENLTEEDVKALKEKKSLITIGLFVALLGLLYAMSMPLNMYTCIWASCIAWTTYTMARLAYIRCKKYSIKHLEKAGGEDDR
jgi:hypothetical protein